MSRRLTIVMVVVTAGLLTMVDVAGAQPVSASEREALARLRVERGGRAEDVDPLIRLANEAGAAGLPVQPVVSKIREGISKRATPAAIEGVVRQMTMNMETASGLLRELTAAGNAERNEAVASLAEALRRGVTSDDVSGIQRQSQGRTPVSPQGLASAAEGLAAIKESKLPAAEGIAVMVEALRQGYRSHEMLDLGREIKRRERDYRDGRASLVALRDSIARGTRPDQLFRDSRPGAPERPAATRPDPAGTTRDRATPPERPTRPERPGGDRAR